MEQNMMQQIDIFSPQESTSHVVSSKIDVKRMEFLASESVSWEELFDGFNDLKAITYSSGTNFIGRLLNLFDTAEIIFGCEAVMSYSIQEIMAFQSKLIDRLRSSPSYDAILKKIDRDKLHLYVVREKLSHEKLYLLSSNGGKKRVISGSANMSFNAFNGRQRENIWYADGDEIYNCYLSEFNILKESSSDNISHKALCTADDEENVDALPIAETTNVRTAIVIEPSMESKEDIQFVLDVDKRAKKIAPFCPKPDKTGKIIINPKNIQKLKRSIHDETVKQKDQHKEHPQLIIDVLNSTVTLNDENIDLNPAAKDIQNDVDLFLKYMNGYKSFHGETHDLQCRYFEFANWFFCSPFMATMRDMASRYDLNLLPYPVFGLLYGHSKAGKTTFLETLLKMMIGQKPKISAQEFTRGNIEYLKNTVKGAPIIVDDIVNTRFNQHAIETIKTDNFGIADHMVNYPAVVISANDDVKAVSPEVIRRTIICRVQAGLTNTEVMQSKIVRTIQKNIGTAFYREYLRRMLFIVQNLIETMKDDSVEVAPDILKESSEVICSIIKEHSDNTPEYIKQLSLDDYFNEKVTGKYAIKTIRTVWETNPNTFLINRKGNELKYNALTTLEADRLIKELPENLEARKSREFVIMKLDEAEKFFGIKFKKNLLQLLGHSIGE